MTNAATDTTRTHDRHVYNTASTQTPTSQAPCNSAQHCEPASHGDGRSTHQAGVWVPAQGPGRGLAHAPAQGQGLAHAPAQGQAHAPAQGQEQGPAAELAAVRERLWETPPSVAAQVLWKGHAMKRRSSTHDTKKRKQMMSGMVWRMWEWAEMAGQLSLESWSKTKGAALLRATLGGRHPIIRRRHQCQCRHPRWSHHWWWPWG